jgi:hypothetical protein
VRAALLVVLAGCFSPDPPPNQTCKDWCPPPESCIANTCQIDLGEDQPNYAFVTPTPIPLTAVSMLDETCATLAAKNKIPGAFFAWMSTSSANMQQRFAGNSARGWIRPDGKPFADRLDDILAGKTYFPLRIGADGKDVGDVTVATATRADGAAGDTCNDLSPMDGVLITYGKADAGARSWTELGLTACNNVSLHFYCFGKDRANTVTVTPPESGHKRVFVTKNPYTMRPPRDADAICNSDAGGGMKFAALVATGEQSVAERFRNSTGPWFRADGVRVTEDMQSFAAPIELAFDGTRIRKEAWFGASSLTERAETLKSCASWTGGAATVGHTDRSGGAAPFDIVPGDCATGQYHYYCAEL